MKCNVNRRYFLKKLRAALVVSSYVSVLKAFDNVRDADCPGGGPDYDICNEALADPDSCPGERPPIDECETGERKEDYCDSGSADADVCNSKIKYADQCSSGVESDDNCDENKTNPDQCYSGVSPEPDRCPEAGGINDGDNCPGGSSSVDNCGKDRQGEECSIEQGWFGLTYGADTCNEEDADDCHGTADVCNKGENSVTGSGDYDSCGPAYGIGPEGSDTCFDGSKTQDRCGTIEGDPDLCIASKNGDNGDYCNMIAEISDPDNCFQGLPSSDVCNPEVGDDDECPDGSSPEDECSSFTSENDICLPESESADRCGPTVIPSDECLNTQDSCNSGNQDIVE